MLLTLGLFHHKLYLHSYRGGYIAITLFVRPSVRPLVRSHFPGLPHIYFLFTARLRICHVCRHENFRNRYLSFYWKKWLYIWYVALAWWLVPCLPFPCLPHIYFLFTVGITNERVGVFLARRSVQHLVELKFVVHYQLLPKFELSRSM